jgi:phosphatidylinositol alpha-1,6-mannosyltransferase
MKIALITSLFPPGGGGAALVYRQVCSHLQAEVLALAPASADPAAARFDAEQAFPIVRLPFLAPKALRRGPKWVRTLWKVMAGRLLRRLPATVVVARQLSRFKPDVVCLGGLATLYWLAPLARWLFGARAIFYIHGEEVFAIAHGPVTQWFFRRSVAALRRADAVVAVSAATARRLTELGVAPERVRVIYSGVDHKRFFPGPPDAAVRQKHDLAGKRVILTIARLEERKGHESVLRALPAVLREVPNAVYVVAGEGPSCEMLEKLAESLGVSDHVVFAGALSDAEVGAYYRTCDVFVQPNRQTADDDEGFGLVFLEASACRKPVIGGRSGGVPEAVLDGETGLLVDGNSAQETAEALLRILTDAGLAERLASHGWTRAQRFDWRETAAQFNSLCRWTLEPSREAPLTGSYETQTPLG